MKDDKKNKAKDVLIQEYENLMESSKESYIIPVQWFTESDTFEKFSLYENYTPVRTSDNTSPESY